MLNVLIDLFLLVLFKNVFPSSKPQETPVEHGTIQVRNNYIYLDERSFDGVENECTDTNSEYDGYDDFNGDGPEW